MNNITTQNRVSINQQLEFQKKMREAVKIHKSDGSAICVFAQEWLAKSMSDHLLGIGITEANGKQKIYAQDLKDDNDLLTCNFGWCITLSHDNLHSLRVKFDRKPTSEEQATAQTLAATLKERTQTTGKNAKDNLHNYVGRTIFSTLRDLATALELYATTGNVTAEFIPAISAGMSRPLPQSALEIFQETLDPHKMFGVTAIIQAIEKQQTNLDVAETLKEIQKLLRTKFPE